MDRSTDEAAENASGSENEYSEEDEDITEFKPGQLRPTPSPVMITVYASMIGIRRPSILRVPIRAKPEELHGSEMVR